MKPRHEGLLSTFAFEFNLRCYTEEDPELLKQMEEDHRELDAKRRNREAKLNELGVFDAAVNEVGRCRLTPGSPKVDPRLTPGRPQVDPRLTPG